MREMSLKIVVLLLVAICSTEAAKCRGRYMEMRGGDGFVTRGGCRGLDTQIQEEYWTTIGYDGVLRDGRTTDDFLIFPENENNGHSQRNSFVGYWITRSKYGQNHHYEAFGHAFIKPDGRVCGWFVGLHREVVEVCGGFRVLSRSRRNPHEQIPFEWVQGPQYRNRDVLGFHHHKIAKYEHNGDEVFFGDADIKSHKFHGVSPVSEDFVELSGPEDFHRKVWLLRKKSLAPPPSDIRVPVSPPKPREDLDIYHDPHHEARIANMRLYPYYDQYGRPSGSQTDSHRPAYDTVGRRIPFETSQNSENPPQSASQYYQYAQDSQPAPSRDHPEYEAWLRNQYRIRGINPRGSQSRGDYSQQNSQRVESNSINFYPEQRQIEYQQTSYNIQPSVVDQSDTNQVSYPNDQQNSDGRNIENFSNDQNPRSDGQTYYSVNPGNPGAQVESSGIDSRVDGEYKTIHIPRNDESTDIRRNPDSHQYKFISSHPPIVIRDKKGNIYERRVVNGKVYYTDASGNIVTAKISNSDIEMKVEEVLENRRRQEEKMRYLLQNSENSESFVPNTAAEEARQGK